MNFIQKIRASHLNRHGFIDVLVGVIAFQFIYISLLFNLGNSEIDMNEMAPPSVSFILFTGLVIAPFFENLLLIGVAALHEKLFNRVGLFIFAPLLLTSLHFYNPRPMHYCKGWIPKASWMAWRPAGRDPSQRLKPTRPKARSVS